jgi:hypothetical protein
VAVSVDQRLRFCVSTERTITLVNPRSEAVDCEVAYHRVVRIVDDFKSYACWSVLHKHTVNTGQVFELVFFFQTRRRCISEILTVSTELVNLIRYTHLSEISRIGLQTLRSSSPRLIVYCCHVYFCARDNY